MLLEGSCHCGAVRFNVESSTPYPYMRCYCSICRKTAGGGGYAINIMGDAKTLQVEGKEYLSVYQALVPDGEAEGKLKPSEARRHFCKQCGSALYLYDPTWPDWVYPFASAIDTPLPKPPELTHIMLEFVAPWVTPPRGPRDVHFPGYPAEAILDWHGRHELTVT
ncbi:MAG TPA: GFA family protein [Gammaproteobacteria bacterium]|jgi:hypothetical protein